MTNSAPVTERSYRISLILVTALFFLWALGVNLNDVLIPHLKKVFDLNDFQSALIQVAFFGGYCLSALPAGRLLERIGYKNGIVVGLLTCATGALLFIPAASIQVYGLFLFASFVMACGQGVLEVAANPYVTLLGPAESSEQRLNLAQSFNAVGAVVTPFIGSAFILSALEYSREKLTTMSPAEMARYRTAVVSTVRMPYLVIAAIFLAYGVVIFLSKLPDVGATDEAVKQESTREELRDIWRYGHLVKGVVAQFFYVGAQIGVASFVIRLAQHSIPGMLQKDWIHDRKVLRFLRHEARACRQAAFTVFAIDSGLSAGRSSRLRRGTPLGCNPDRLLSFDYVSNHLCSKHQAAWAIHKTGIVLVGGFDHRWGHLPRNNGIHLRPQQYSRGFHSAANLPSLCALLRGTRLSARPDCRNPSC